MKSKSVKFDIFMFECSFSVQYIIIDNDVVAMLMLNTC